MRGRRHGCFGFRGRNVAGKVPVHEWAGTFCVAEMYQNHQLHLVKFDSFSLIYIKFTL